jgi:hypothetical protein
MSKVVFKKTWNSGKFGTLRPGMQIEGELLGPWHDELLRQGVIERMETKVLRENPFMAVGQPVALSASPAVQVSQQTTLPLSNRGGKPKVRPRKG